VDWGGKIGQGVKTSPPVTTNNSTVAASSDQPDIDVTVSKLDEKSHQLGDIWDFSPYHRLVGKWGS
jgi:hypothetical protein